MEGLHDDPRPTTGIGPILLTTGILLTLETDDGIGGQLGIGTPQLTQGIGRWSYSFSLSVFGGPFSFTFLTQFLLYYGYEYFGRRVFDNHYNVEYPFLSMGGKFRI